MNLREINFSFDGLHCMRDFGLMYVEDGGHPITPETARNEYEIAGMSGTLLMPGETKKTKIFTGTLYFMDSPPSQEAAQENLRRIGAWLTSGRKMLVFDYELTRYYLAQVDAETVWDFSNWVEGGLKISFTAQPFAYNRSESNAEISTALTSLNVTLALDSGLPAPLSLTLTNTGAAVITGFSATLGGRSVTFAGMSIAAGGKLTISLEPPISALYADGSSALPQATALEQLLANPGSNVVGLTITYGAGEKGADIVISARGRY